MIFSKKTSKVLVIREKLTNFVRFFMPRQPSRMAGSGLGIILICGLIYCDSAESSMGISLMMIINWVNLTNIG